jgi:hypothetical protein
MEMIDQIEVSENAYKDNVYVETTPSGSHFRPAAPVLNISDACHALSQVNRYNGHGHFPFSVATHSVLVSLLMEEVVGGDPFEGLWHDGAEYVLSDIASPFKTLLPDWKALDKKIDGAVRAQLGLAEKKSQECNTADLLALFIEAAQLMPSKGEGWEDPLNLRPQALALRRQGWKISEIDWRQSRAIFAQRHNELRPVNIPRIEF